jgi:hypothetical protein
MKNGSRPKVYFPRESHPDYKKELSDYLLTHLYRSPRTAKKVWEKIGFHLRRARKRGRESFLDRACHLVVQILTS